MNDCRSLDVKSFGFQVRDQLFSFILHFRAVTFYLENTSIRLFVSWFRDANEKASKCTNNLCLRVNQSLARCIRLEFMMNFKRRVTGTDRGGISLQALTNHFRMNCKFLNIIHYPNNVKNNQIIWDLI